MSDNIWQKLLSFGVKAPSGDNSQPWRFEIQEGRLLIFSVPENDNPAYNYEQRGSLVAIGALIENLEIASTQFGFEAKVDVVADLKTNFIGSVELIASMPKDHPLFSCIETRATNRKPYKSEILTDEKLQSIKDGCDSDKIQVRFVTDKDKIDKLAFSASLNEQIVLENFLLHKYFFDHIRWDEGEERRERSGLYLKTLELAHPQEVLFKILRSWRLISFANKLGFGKMVARENGKIYSQSSAVGAINIVGDTPKLFIEVGRVLQRIWLRVEKDGLSMQLLTGVLFFMHRINAGQNGEFFLSKHLAPIKKAYENIRTQFGFVDGKTVLMFRIGKGGSPSGLSSRKTPFIK